MRRTAVPARYQSVARTLRQRLLDGEYPPRSRLPNQRQLARQFGTTLMTIRQALALLRDEGLVEARHGRGTFVADLGSMQDPIYLASFAEVMAQRGIDVETVIVSRAVEAASPAVADALRLPLDRGRVVALGRVRRVAGVPIVYQRSFLPGSLEALMARYDAAVPLYAFLRDHAGIVAVRSVEMLRPCTLGHEEAAMLQAPLATPAFHSVRVSFDGDGRPFLYDEAVLRGDRVELRIAQEGIHASTSYHILPPGTGKAPAVCAMTAQPTGGEGPR
ncbi:GntR family transcriptional regulator [Carboxydochorda subterranea]|uniref:GntR family transcriptional regulator n=1 Tax=Carboxydichorda subterranea TaxID=3109565 RepID=A0ABZ1BWZ0_9FIRM|nr:GntR family transcriptional regulator [Limnochorda sp. L945t]WRP17181.1 GntR family transcriptional regulator [Limnochorda sp. L945t]